MKLGLFSAAWLAGILIGLSPGFGSGTALLLAGAAGLAFTGLRLARLPAMPAILAAVCLLGMARAEASQPGPGVLERLAGREATAKGRIADDPELTASRVRFELQVSEILLDGEALAAKDRWLVYASPPDELVARRAAPFFRYGDEVEVQGAPREPQPIDGFDYPAYLASQGITATLFARQAEVTDSAPAHWRTTLYGIRGRLADSLEGAMPYPASALGTAMLLGKRETLPAGLVDKFRDTGAAHLLAISGLHVGVLLAATTGAGAWLLGRRRPAYLVAAGAAIWLYALLAGASPSALGAATMGTVYLAALGLGRPSSVLPALALAAAIMTALTPSLIRQVSFQLSFAAVAGIGLALAMWGGRPGWGAGRSSGWMARLAGWAAALIIVSTAATLATWPLVAANFGRVALLGVPVSLLTVPAVALLIVATLAAAGGGLVLAPLGVVLGWVAAAPAAWVIGVVSVFPSWTVEADWVGRPLLVAWYGGLGLALLAAQPHRARRWRRAIADIPARLRSWRPGGLSGPAVPGTRSMLPAPHFSITIAIFLTIGAAILWYTALDGPDGHLHVHFLDIGQGDSILVVTPSGRQALIDGGPDGDRTSQAVSAALPRGDRSVDLVVMTHLDSDHSRGLLEVLDRFSVGAVLTGPQAPGSEMQAQWEQRLNRHEIAPVEITAGHVIRLDDGVELHVLHPDPARALGNFNNDSLVVKLTYGEVSFLLTADIEQEAEDRLVNSGADLRSTVLKVAHHGSGTSTTQRFLEAVGPAIAVVSAGEGNPHGHPAAAVMQRLEAEAGARNVYRTDHRGTVEAVSDGNSVWVHAER